MRVFAPLLVLLVLAAGAFAYVERTTPDWYARMRYPLRYEHIVTGHARNYDLDAALIAAVIYRPLRPRDQRPVRLVLPPPSDP
jgi:hypothetical protein